MNKGMGRSPRALALAVAIAAVLLCAGPCLAYTHGDPEVRAMWVDCLVGHPGLFSITEINKLLGVPGDPNKGGDLREANCNTAIIEVRRAGKVIYDSALDEPWLTGFDALQAVLDRAHDTTGGKKRIEVHAWIVTFNTGGGQIWEDHMDADNPDNYWPTLTNTGATSNAMWDPGHPKVQKYIVDVMMDLVNNYDVDGVHYDYIRFNAATEGYNPTSIARYNARHGTTGQPSTTDDRFDQWRRDQITGIVRQVYARIQAVKPHVLQSGSFVTWYPAPASPTRAAFQTTRPYGNRSDGVFSDWDAWMQEGIMDFGVPMNYYDEQGSLAYEYDYWMNFLKDRNFNRHMVNGPALYKNWLSNNDVINQLLATRDPSPAGNTCAGFCGFSYHAPYVITKPNGYGSWDIFEPVFTAQVTPTWADIPDRPWKSAPTKGHISGSITIQGTSAWADGATVSISPDPRPEPYNVPMVCDGTGFYAFIDVPPGTYTVTASMPGYADGVRQVNVQIGSVIGNMYVTDMTLGASTELVISGVASSGVTNNAATITWTTNLPADSQVEYGPTASYGSTTVLDPEEVTSHSQTLTGLTPGTVYHYRVRSSTAGETSYSGDYTFTTDGPPVISNVACISTAPDVAIINWTTDTPSDSRVNYGTTTSYGQTASNSLQLTSHSILIYPLTGNTEYHFQCVSTNGNGTTSTGDYTFTTPDGIIIDNIPARWQSTGTGAWSVGSNSAVPKIGADYLYYAGETSPTRKCTWTPLLTVGGYYDVYAFYQKGTNRNPAATYTTYYNGGQVASVQNQRSATANEGGWYLIAQDKPFFVGSAGYVELTNQSTYTGSTNLVSADAVKWVLKTPFDVTPPTVSISAPSVALTKSGPVTFTVTYGGADSVTLRQEDLYYQGSGTAYGMEVSVSGSGTTTRTVTISSVGGTGTLSLCLVPGTASDAAGNLAPAAGPSQAFTVDNTAPTINSVDVSPAMAGIGDPIHVTVDTYDTSAIARVTANNIDLYTPTGYTWMGNIQAIGPNIAHDVEIIVTDEVGNVSTDTSQSYKTAQVVAALTEASWSPAVVSGNGLFIFKFFGRVTEAGDHHFTLSDGSGRPVTVHAQGYKATIHEGDYVSVRGIISSAGWIESEAALIAKY